MRAVLVWHEQYVSVVKSPQKSLSFKMITQNISWDFSEIPLCELTELYDIFVEHCSDLLKQLWHIVCNSVRMIDRAPWDMICVFPLLFPLWCHQMETFSTLLAICGGNSPVPGEFPTQRPVTRSFDVFFDLRLYKRLSKQSWGWWFEMLLHPLWCHHKVPCAGFQSNISEPCRIVLHMVAKLVSLKIYITKISVSSFASCIG